MGMHLFSSFHMKSRNVMLQVTSCNQVKLNIWVHFLAVVFS